VCLRLIFGKGHERNERSPIKNLFSFAPDATYTLYVSHLIKVGTTVRMVFMYKTRHSSSPSLSAITNMPPDLFRECSAVTPQSAQPGQRTNEEILKSKLWACPPLWSSGYRTFHSIQGSRAETRKRAINFKCHTNPQHAFLCRESKAVGPK
jgi:hypothetical protein